MTAARLVSQPKAIQREKRPKQRIILDPEESLEPSVFDPCREAALESRLRRQHFIDRAAAKLHAQLAGETRTWCEIEEVVAINRAYKEILQRAAASDVDLIVMGAQGSSGIGLMLYGSNTHVRDT